MELEAWLKLAAPLITAAILGVVRRITLEKPKVISWLGFGASFYMEGDSEKNILPHHVHTHSIVIKNVGKRTATNVRLGHHNLPLKFNVSPSVQYDVLTNPDGKKELVFPTLVPKEDVTISYMYFTGLTIESVNSYAKFDDGPAKIVHALPTPQPATWVVRLIQVLSFVGASYVIYWLIRGSIYLANTTFPTA